VSNFLQISCRSRWAAALFLAIPALGQAKELPLGFAYISEVDPTIVQDIRYAGANNFVGRPLPGYDAPECVLKRDVAEALKQVQQDLAPHKLSLKVYDCYRPARAVEAMVNWSNKLDVKNTKSFYPRVEKARLFVLGYIAAKSAHSTGYAVDVTIVDHNDSSASTSHSSAQYGPCTGPAPERSPDNGVDMGTGFDCFDSNSHTASANLGSEQRRWRQLLVDVMSKRGFENYHREWWHFKYAVRQDEPSHYLDFAIPPRDAK
jgi:zinc D-Ala-D-Ala dipeptidase